MHCMPQASLAMFIAWTIWTFRLSRSRNSASAKKRRQNYKEWIFCIWTNCTSCVINNAYFKPQGALYTYVNMHVCMNECVYLSMYVCMSAMTARFVPLLHGLLVKVCYIHQHILFWSSLLISFSIVKKRLLLDRSNGLPRDILPISDLIVVCASCVMANSGSSTP